MSTSVRLGTIALALLPFGCHSPDSFLPAGGKPFAVFTLSFAT